MLILYKRWMALRRNVVTFSGSLDLSMPVRVLAYGLYSTLALRYERHPAMRGLKLTFCLKPKPSVDQGS